MDEFELNLSDKLNSVAEGVNSDAKITDMLNRNRSMVTVGFKVRILLVATAIIALLGAGAGGFVVAQNQSLASNTSHGSVLTPSANSHPPANVCQTLTCKTQSPMSACSSKCPLGASREMVPYCPQPSGSIPPSPTGNSGTVGSTGSTSNTGTVSPKIVSPSAVSPPANSGVTSTQATNQQGVASICNRGTYELYDVFRRTNSFGVTERLYREENSSICGTCEVCLTAPANVPTTIKGCSNSVVGGGGTVNPNTGNSGTSNSGVIVSPMTSDYVLELSNSNAVSTVNYYPFCSNSNSTLNQQQPICSYVASTFGVAEGSPTAVIVLEVNPTNNLGITEVTGSISNQQNSTDSMNIVNGFAVLTVPLPASNSSSSTGSYPYNNALSYTWDLSFYNSSNSVEYSKTVTVQGNLGSCVNTSVASGLVCG